MTFETSEYALADEALVDRLTGDLVDGRMDTITNLFREQHARAPHVIWNPTSADALHPKLAAFLRAAHAAAGPTGDVSAEWLDTDAFAGFRDWTLVLDPIEGGRDFYYSHYGSEVEFGYGRSLAGHRTSEIGGHISVFFMALYRAVIQRRQIAKSIHEPPKQVFARNWRRLIVPLRNDDADIVRLVTINIADNDLRAGLEVLPTAVMVVKADGQICFANRVACNLFEKPRTFQPETQFSDFTGVDLQLPESPEARIRLGPTAPIRKVIVRNHLIVPIRFTVGATLYRNQPFYIVSARTEDD